MPARADERVLAPPFDTVVGLAFERLSEINAPSHDDPSPMAEGGTPLEWAAVGGIGAGSQPHEVIRHRYPEPMDVAPYQVEDVAHAALQRLCNQARIDRIPGVPMRYRALNGRRRRKR